MIDEIQMAAKNKNKGLKITRDEIISQCQHWLRDPKNNGLIREEAKSELAGNSGIALKLNPVMFWTDYMGRANWRSAVAAVEGSDGTAQSSQLRRRAQNASWR